jgi:uncharacterized membrane protein YkvA (DUF1232 family)
MTSNAHALVRRGPRTRGGSTRHAGRDRGDHSILDHLRQVPAYGRLIAGLMTDERVSLVDKALVVAAIGYLASPLDLMGKIPILGEIDDLFIILLALQHLVANAGADVVLDHWHGDIEELEKLDLRRALLAAAFFLPRRLRRRLRVIGRLD